MTFDIIQQPITIIVLFHSRQTNPRSSPAILPKKMSKDDEEKPTTYGIDPATLENDYVSASAETPLRICCYGSSSAKTPDKFLKEAWSLGYILARRGHTCVNGAGSYGCMVGYFYFHGNKSIPSNDSSSLLTTTLFYCINKCMLYF